MKKILSLLTVSVLGVASITNVTAFSQAKTTYKNINSGTASDSKLDLKIQLNASAWTQLLVHKGHFTINDKWGFGAYLLQYANDNEFHHTWGNFFMPDVPNAVAFSKSNIIENYFGHFGYWMEGKSAAAACLFNNEYLDNYYRKSLYTLYYNLKNANITTAVVFTLSGKFNPPLSYNGGYVLGPCSYKIL